MFSRVRHGIARVRAFLRREADDREFDEELAAHVAMLVDDNLARGMSGDEARRAALVRVGARASLREEHRAARGLPAIDTCVQDFRFGVRQLVKHGGFAGTTIFVLALGIAANVAIFAFADAALLEPLPYRDPARLMTAFSTRPDRPEGQAKALVSYLNFVDWQQRNRVFSALGAFDVRPGFILTTAAGPQRVTGLRVTSGFFRTLGVTPLLGRDFQPQEEGPGAPATVMLSHRTWQDRFNARQDVLGQTVTLQGEPYVVIGVLPPQFHFPMAGHAEFWATIRGGQPCWTARGCRSLETVARLADGVSIAAAQTALDGLMRELRQEYNDRNPETAAVVPLSEVVFGDIRPIMLMLWSGASLLLLIACINAVCLLLTRSDSRVREIAVRHALGASSMRLAMQFATEAAILVAVSGVLALGLATAGIRLLTSLLSADMISRMPYLEGLGLSPRLVAFTAVLCAVATLVFTVMPSARASAARRFEALKENSRGSAGMTWRRLGRSLVVAELALAVILLVGAGLLTKSAYRLLRVDTGFAAERLVIANVGPAIVRPPAATGAPPEPPGVLARQVGERLTALSGVEAVGYADLLPLAAGLAPTSGFQVPGRLPQGAVEDYPVRRVSAGYFAALQAPLLHGREFTDDEVAFTGDVAIINDTAARRYFPGEQAVGQRIVLGAPPARQIVGVVADIKDGPLETPPLPAAYVPFDQVGFALVVRTSQPEDAILPVLATAIRDVRSDLLFQGASTMTERLHAMPSASMKNASAWLVGGFAASALILSLIGLYGVVAYSVGQRGREIALRMALGAQRRAIYRLVVREAAVMVVAGIALGLLSAMLVARLIRSLLFGIQSWDVPTLLTAAVVLMIPALLASFIPARRAASANPADVLSVE